MNPREFRSYQKEKLSQFMTIHWPRAKALLKAGKSPNEVVEIMNQEGYWGRSSNRFSHTDLFFLSEMAAEWGTRETGECQGDAVAQDGSAPPKSR